MTEDLIAVIIVLSVLLLLGALFLTGRGAWLIAGYNTLPKAERERFDRRALCRFMGKLMFYCAACTLLLGADELWPGRGFGLAGGIWLVAGIVFALVYANTNGRFLRK